MEGGGRQRSGGEHAAWHPAARSAGAGRLGDALEALRTIVTEKEITAMSNGTMPIFQHAYFVNDIEEAALALV